LRDVSKSVFASLGLDDLSESEAAFLGCAVLGVGVALIARYATGYDALLHEKLCGLLSSTRRNSVRRDGEES